MSEKPLLRFLLLAPLCFALLAWLGPSRTYVAALRACAGALYESTDSRWLVQFSAYQDPNGWADSEITVGVPWANVGVERPYSGLLLGYEPTAIFLALLLATPLPFARKWRAFLIGFGLMQALVAIRLGVVVHVLSETVDDRVRNVAASPFWAWAMLRTHWLLVSNAGTRYAGAVLVWMAVTLRPGDLARLQPNRPASSAAQPTG